MTICNIGTSIEHFTQQRSARTSSFCTLCIIQTEMSWNKPTPTSDTLTHQLATFTVCLQHLFESHRHTASQNNMQHQHCQWHTSITPYWQAAYSQCVHIIVTFNHFTHTQVFKDEMCDMIINVKTAKKSKTFLVSQNKIVIYVYEATYWRFCSLDLHEQSKIGSYGNNMFISSCSTMFRDSRLQSLAVTATSNCTRSSHEIINNSVNWN